MGVSGTPTILVNVPGKGTRRAPGFDFQSIAATIDAMQSEGGESN
jgi:hypothetical protein